MGYVEPVPFFESCTYVMFQGTGSRVTAFWTAAMKFSNSVVMSFCGPVRMELPSRLIAAAGRGEIAEWDWEPRPRRITACRTTAADAVGATTVPFAPVPEVKPTAAGFVGNSRPYTRLFQPVTASGYRGPMVVFQCSARAFASSWHRVASATASAADTEALKVSVMPVRRPEYVPHREQ
jgi:hypothetical protein